MKSGQFWNIIFPILLILAANEFRKAVLNFWDSSPTVTISLGKIRGQYVRTSSGEFLYSFRGIRYAQSPINELRFAVNLSILNENQWTIIFKKSLIFSHQCQLNRGLERLMLCEIHQNVHKLLLVQLKFRRTVCD